MLNWIKAKMSDGSENSELLVDYYKQIDNEEEEEFEYIVCVAGTNELPKKVVGILCRVDSFVFSKPYNISCHVVKKHASQKCKQVHIVPHELNSILFKASQLIIHCNSKVSQVLSYDGVYQQEPFYTCIQGSSNCIKQVIIISTLHHDIEDILRFTQRLYTPQRLVLIMDFPQNLFYSFMS